MRKKENTAHLYRVDNAAQIYTASARPDSNAVYRVAAQLTEPVQPEVLARAVKELAPRFPTYYVQVYEGKHWDYLRPVVDYDIVSEETEYPCRPFATIGKGGKPLFRVLYQGNRVSCEFFHVLTDGTGAMNYLKTLLAYYLELQGILVEKGNGILDAHVPPSPSELEDAYQHLYEKRRRASREEPDAYQFQPPARKNYLKRIYLYLPLGEMKQMLKTRYQCTITEYLTAVYAYVFLQEYQRDTGNPTRNNPIRISVPVNLRPIFGSDTMRNFALTANVDIEPARQSYTFSAVLEEIRRKLHAGLERETLHNMASQNMQEEKMLISRIAPNRYKKPVMRWFYEKYGERKYTAPLSNLGLQKLPPSLAAHVKCLELMVGETRVNRLGCGVVGTGDTLTITFTSITEDERIQRAFLSFLEAEGLPVVTEYHV